MAQQLADQVPGTLPGAHPSATVVLLRNSIDGPQVLMVRRNASLAFHGGAWVFPGGRIDEPDFGSAPNDIVAAARAAAAREAREEAGVNVDGHALVPISRWVTPIGLPKRFDTWFFAAQAKEEDVRVDGQEIDDHSWLRPADAIAAQARGEIELPPPTFVTLDLLRPHPTVAHAIEFFAAEPTLLFFPRMAVVAGGACTLYEGDAGYEESDAHIEGPRHRLWMVESGWRYERSLDVR